MTQRVFIVHGYEGSPNGNWFDWLSAKVREHGAEASALHMPDPGHPSAPAWQHKLDQHIGAPAGNTFLVGHSLGCITLLHFLSRHRPEKIGGLVLAAGFAATLPPLPVLDDYIRASAPDFEALINIDMPVHCLISDNDTHVPPPLSEQMAAKLGSPVSWIANGGHLMASDGFTALPPVWEALMPMLAVSR
ncbi:alpha/beta hydrolase [Uruburuella testudinis]|uniref:Alpha/beta hydrolase n=1 Tax=Uruburuella testudinis TaxID=1282863 RepID=A0ABY4DPS1_9NEIS|nr:alpha/beta fold hydrolase [Uruburuella testudinis]UOO81047.1 alpha/beta hydrolase [Uruburuella testudinis]